MLSLYVIAALHSDTSGANVIVKTHVLEGRLSCMLLFLHNVGGRGGEVGKGGDSFCIISHSLFSYFSLGLCQNCQLCEVSEECSVSSCNCCIHTDTSETVTHSVFFWNAFIFEHWTATTCMTLYTQLFSCLLKAFSVYLISSNMCIYNLFIETSCIVFN